MLRSEEDLFAALAGGAYRSVVVVLGAGVSVAAGIPDFRSPDGLFEVVRTRFGERFPELWGAPERLLSRDFCERHPAVWHAEVVPLLRSWKLEEARPTAAHRFLAWLHGRGWLRRVYTQNVDGLELHPDVLRDAAEPTTSSSSSGGGDRGSGSGGGAIEDEKEAGEAAYRESVV